MIMQDKMEKERVDAKNSVEEYVYEMRDKLSSAIAEFMKEAVRRIIKTHLFLENLVDRWHMRHGRNH